MTTVVVPFRGLDSKTRLEPAAGRVRAVLAEAMLADVLAAAVSVGRTVVVTGDAALALPAAVARVSDPGGGQGAAVARALSVLSASDGLPLERVLVVNADLPCVRARDLLALAGAVPADGVALAAALDGTTNALALARASLFAPLYGSGSAARFAALAPSRCVDIPNLADDVDTLDDLARLGRRLGPHTHAAVAALGLEAAA
jgi:2-phospho-L-lactate guanylyltransferase